MSIRSCWLMVLLISSVSLLIFNQGVLSVTERGLLICPSLLSVLPVFASCILKLFFGTYIFRILCLFTIGPCIIMYYSSLSLIIFLAVKNTLSNINMATSAFFCLVLPWCVFPHPF